MFRALAILIVTILYPTQLWAQLSLDQDDSDPTCWINYNQSYFKISIAQLGVYRLTAKDLKRAGVPVDQLDPTALQLFHRGIEQAIYVEGEADHQFDPSDFLEFYGRTNDGAQDSLLYRPHRARPHSYYSLFNDTTAFFLTWTTKPGKRIVTDTDTISINLRPEAYHWADELQVFTDTYPGWAAGLPYATESSYYEAGEGYTGPIQPKAKPYMLAFQLTNPALTGPKPQLNLLLMGRSYGFHQINCSVGAADSSQRLVDSVRFVGYVNRRVNQQLHWSDVSTDNQVKLTTCSRSSFLDDYSVSYARIRYPQLVVGTGQSTQVFQLQPNSLGQSLLIIPDIPRTTEFWDISDPTTPKRLVGSFLGNKQVRLVVNGTKTARTIVAVNQVKTAPVIKPVAFNDWRHRKPTYLIITHEALQAPVRYLDANKHKLVNAVDEYARYRASPEGGGHDTLMATMQQLFDQYSYGERHPLAIRRFAQQMLRQSNGLPPYLFLIGRSRSTPGIRRNPQQALLDMVMTAGFPGSDVALTAGLAANEPDVPALPTGRINAGTPQEVLAYLAKVREHEHENGNGLWRKSWLHLSGGQTNSERVLFRRLVNSYQDQTLISALQPQIKTISKTSDQPAELVTLAEWVNKGVGLITFFGHSGLATTDLGFGFCSNDSLGYRNEGKYPFLLLNGCALGNFFYGRPTLATDWVLTPDRGAIAAIAHCHVGYIDLLNTYTSTFYQLLGDCTQTNPSLGQLQQETIRRVLAQNSDSRTLANAQQMVLQGDPAIRLFPPPLVNHSIGYESISPNLTIYPNPFREQTFFSYTIPSEPAAGLSMLTITDLTGHVVRHITMPARLGVNEWTWDGRGDTGFLLPAGVYLYSLSLPGVSEQLDSALAQKRLEGRLVLIR